MGVTVTEVVATIGARRGLHGRPAALVAARASRSDAWGIDVARADESAGPWYPATSVIDLLALDLARGERIVLRTGRADAAGVLAELVEMLESDLDA